MSKSKTYETFKALRFITGKKPIVNYVRDKNREPIGVVIAINKNKVGWSKRKGNGRWNASAGMISAYVSAIRNDTLDTIPNTNRKFQAIRAAFTAMENRSIEYYKMDHPTKHGAIIVAGQVRA